ncbi:hypothetical protein GTP23_12130 [Pseudoduganella sp. FT93W]|uniref:Uncharacterized protein n=1 Tax=Duganella fentianensis TaxID=2692177 RepID=A0A845I1Z0_9BURK|nr:hypothetical protein [Duganella fentianensis]MYN45795.1 hypothetical protein [Duganella fentianensis]
MSKNVLLACAIGAAVWLVVSKQVKTKPTGSGAAMTNAEKQQYGLIYTPEQRQTANVNGDMWTRLLGDGWRNMVSAQNSDGTRKMVVNDWGQVTTTDGKPIGSGDPVADIMNADGVNLTMPVKNYLGGLSQYDGYITPSILQWEPTQ